jgi:D-lyxose ketol-isomerase
MKRCEYQKMCRTALEYYERAHIVLSKEESSKIEVADFGLGKVEEVGLEILTYINTDRVCAKEMVLVPHQACPEHMHVPSKNAEGKEETFRCRYGKVYLYTDDGGVSKREDVTLSVLPDTTLTVFHETVLLPGEQFTIMPGTLHWFAARSEGAVISEFSTRSTDETDVFSDPRIVRIPQIEE